MSSNRPVTTDSAERLRARELSLAKTSLARFARGNLFRTFANAAALTAALLVSMGPVSPLQAQTLIYFDSNGATAGTDPTATTGAWSATGNATWTTNNGGSSNTTNWSALATGANSIAIFSAFHPGNFSNANLAITASGAIANVGGIRFTEGNVTITGGTLNLSQAATITAGSLPGSVINSVIAGAFTLTKDGPYTLELGGANTFTGTTTVSAGTLKLGNAAALGNSTAGATSVTSGATLDLNSVDMTGNAEALTISGTGATGKGSLINSNTTGTAVYVGNITLGAVAASIGGEGNINVTGRFVGGSTQTLNKVGNGTVTLGNGNTYTGLTTIEAGTLVLGNSTALGTTAAGTTVRNGGSLNLSGQTVGNEAITLNGSGVSNGGALQNSTGTASLSGGITLASDSSITTNGTLTLSGAISASTFDLTLGGTGTGNATNVISGSAPVGLTKTGTGTWVLSGTNTYTGLTVVSGGTLKLNNTAALGNSTVEGSGTFVSSGAALDLNGVTLAAPETLTIAGSGTAGEGALTNSGAAATYTGAVNLNSSATVGGSGNIIISGYVSNAEAGSLTKVGGNTLTLSGTNAYNGVTTISNGTLKVGSYSALGTSAGGDANYGTTVATGASLDLNGNTISGIEALTLSGTGNGSVGALTNSTGSAIFYGPITLGTDAPSIGGAGNITLMNSISNGSSNSITKVGTGTLTLLGYNNHTGTTTVSEGILSIGVNYPFDGSTALPMGTPLGSTASGTTVASGASLELRPGTTANAFITVGSEALTISGTGNASTGALRNLAGNNTYGGLITLGASASIQSDAGTLSITNTGTITGSGNNLTLAGAGDGTLASIIGTGSGNLTKTGTGDWTLTGTNTYTGGTTLSGGTLILGSVGAVGSSGTITFNGGALGYTAASASTDYSSRFSNAASQQYRIDTNGQNVTLGTALTSSGGTFTKLGAGNVTITATETFSGTTTVNGGSLILSGASGKLGSGAYVVSGGTLQVGDAATASVADRLTSNTASLTLGNATTLAGGTFALNRGASGANTQTLGTLTVQPGVNAINLANGSGTATLTLAGGSGGYTRSSGGVLNLSTVNGSSSLVFATVPSGTSISGSGNSSILVGAVLNGSDLVHAGGNSGGTANGVAVAAANYTNTSTNVWTAGANMLVTNSTGTLTGAAVNSVTFQGAAARTVTLSGTSSIASGMILVGTGVGANTSTITGGNITSGNSQGDLILINNNTAGDLVINSKITGSNSLTLTGNGTVALGNSTNSYTGGTVLENGTLRLDAATVLGSSAGNLPITGGTLNLNSRNATVGNFTGTGGTILNNSSGSTSTLTIGGSGNYSGNIVDNTSGTGKVALAKSTTGTVVLSGANTYTGGTTLSNGVIDARSNNALGAGTVTVSGTGQLSLNGQGLALGLGSSTLSLASTTGTTVSLINGYTGAGGTTAQFAGNISLAGSTSISSGTAAGNILQLGIPGGYDLLSSPGSVTEYTTIALNGNTLTFTGSANTFTQVEGRITGAGNVVINTSGTVNYFNPRNDYTGNTTVQNGTLLIDTASNTFAPRDTTWNHYTGISGSNLIIGDNSGSTGTAVVNLGNGISQGTVNEAILYTTAVTINSDGLLKLNGNPQTIGTLTMVGGRIDANGSGLYLDYANTAVTINPTATSGPSIIDGTLSLTHHLWAPSESSLKYNRTFTVNPNANNVATGDLVINAVITQGSITKAGNGTMTLATANNDYDGTTTINAGILNIRVGTDGNDKSSLGLSGGSGQGTTVNGNGTLQMQGNIVITKEDLIIKGDGYGGSRGALENLSGNNTWGDGTNGSIVLGANARIGSTSGLLTIASTMSSDASNSYALTISGGGDVTIAGSINTGNLSTATLTKSGAGTLTLTGNSLYGGATNVQAGVLVVGHGGALGSSTVGTTVSSGAELRLSGGISVAGEALSISGTGVSGDGALRNYSGNNVYGGQVTIAASGTRISAENSTNLTMSGGIIASATTHTVNFGGAGNVTSSGTVSLTNNPISKDGTGTLTFSGTTTALGNTTVNAGILAFANTTTVKTLSLLNDSVTKVTSSASVSTGEMTAGGLATLDIAAGSTLTATYTTNTAIFSGQVTGSGTLKLFGNASGAGVTFNQSIYAPNLTVYIGGTVSNPFTFSIKNNAHLTFGDLYITGNTILDFDNSSSTFLSSTNLYITSGVTITVNNWASMMDAWYVTGNSPGFSNNSGGSVTLDQTANAPQNQITFNGYPASFTAWISTAAYPTFREHEIRPVPEPSTYGAIFASGCLGLFGLRRYLRRRAEQKAAQTKQG